MHDTKRIDTFASIPRRVNYNPDRTPLVCIMTPIEGTELIKLYFPNLNDAQLKAFAALGEVYPDWNAKINVISRRDIDGLYERHILHSLAIARFLGGLADGTSFLDLGTGGGFPGIPLAVIYPQCRFLLLDRIGKKLKVAEAAAAAAGLKNVTFRHGDAAEVHERFDYVVSRAVMPLDGLVKIARRLVDLKGQPGAYPPGLVCLKGGDLDKEMADAGVDALVQPLAPDFKEEFFATKQIVYVPL